MKFYYEKNTFGIHCFIVLMTKIIVCVIDEIHAKMPQNLITNIWAWVYSAR